ncbi:hypothetical protein Tco_0277564 [Tanacetum coccineum]
MEIDSSRRIWKELHIGWIGHFSVETHVESSYRYEFGHIIVWGDGLRVGLIVGNNSYIVEWIGLDGNVGIGIINVTTLRFHDYAVFVAHPTPFRKFLEPFLCLHGMSRNYTLDEDTYPSFLHDDRTAMDLFACIQVANPTKVRVVERERAKLLDSTIGRVVLLLPITLACVENELEASVDKLFDEGGSADQGDSDAGGGQGAETELVMGVKIIADENVVAERRKRLSKKRPAVTDASGSSHPPKKLRGDYGTSSRVATGGKSPSVLKELLASSILNVKVGVAAVATLPLVTSSMFAMPERESGAPTDSITGLNLFTIGASARSAIVPLVMTEAVVTSYAVNAPSVPVSKTGTKTTSPVHASMFHDSDSTKIVKADAASPSYSAKQDLSMGSRELNAEISTKFLFCNGMTRFESECEKQAGLLKARDDEVKNLKAHLLLKETEAAEAARLCAQVCAAEATEKIHADEIDALKHRNVALENEKDSLDRKNDGLADQVHALETTCSSLRDQGLLSVVLLRKGMQDGLLASIDHRKAGRNLADFVAYNLAAEADYNFALYYGSAPPGKSPCDAPGMSDLQLDIEQLTLPIHRPEDQVVLGETSLSFSLSVAHSRVERIRENVAAQRIPTAVVSTTSLSTTFASASFVPPITTDAYEIVNVDVQEDAQGNVASFPIVDFEKEELDTTLERDPPS